MKDFNELSENALINLTDEEIEKYVSLRCAEEGIPLIPLKKPVKPSTDIIEGNVMVYKIGDFKTTNKEQADALLTMLNSMDLIDTNYDYGLSSNHKYITELSDYHSPKVESFKVFSREEYKKIEAKLAAYKKLIEEYNDEKDEYDEVVNKASEIRDEILTAISDARRNSREKTKLREEWNRYLDLAEGNTQIALNFMQKIHPEISNYKDLEEELEISAIIS